MEWYEFDFENIKINFPTEEVFQLDTIVKGVRINQLYTTIGNSTLIVQKLPAENKLNDENLSNLPYDYKSLVEYYDGVIAGVKNSSNAKKVEKKEIKLGELIGYNSIYYDENGNSFSESNSFLVNNSLIIVSVYNLKLEQKEIKEGFFNSLNLDNLGSLKQYTGKSKAYQQGYVFGKLLLYALIGIGLFFLIRTLRKKK
ncbi:hypothetical protein QQ020_27210 [Fulvivirgaceae bacterium BMA12]|uniref:Uncharacterized protein n=1 Tax=Agaribacillus aureus TaxID=3051825 RepID=A0ABT8LDF3_9BACT|nr:hypothetical protein [Fulvivirgaceae bacterium BMA12]